MKEKKKQDPKGSYFAHGCIVNNSVPPANEYTAKAVEALSRAAEANAVAIGKIADAIRGGNATIQNGFKMGGGES